MNAAAPVSYSYAVLRAVPRVDREEFINVGVVLYCKDRDFLGAQVDVDEARLLALHPGVSVSALRDQLVAVERVCEGAADAGPVAALSASERFHWLASTRSTLLQASAPHCGLTRDPAATLQHLLNQVVRLG